MGTNQILKQSSSNRVEVATDMWNDKETPREKASERDDAADVFDPDAHGELI